MCQGAFPRYRYIADEIPLYLSFILLTQLLTINDLFFLFGQKVKKKTYLLLAQLKRKKSILKYTCNYIPHIHACKLQIVHITLRTTFLFNNKKNSAMDISYLSIYLVFIFTRDPYILQVGLCCTFYRWTLCFYLCFTRMSFYFYLLYTKQVIYFIFTYYKPYRRVILF